MSGTFSTMNRFLLRVRQHPPRAGFRLLALGLAGLPVLFANTYYVATTGSDYNSGSITAPFATVRKGVGAAVAGDTVYVRGGTYHEAVTISQSGTSSSPITIAGYPGETAILDGGDSIPGAGGALLNLQGAYTTAQDLTIQNSAYFGLYLGGSHAQAHRIKAYRNAQAGIQIISPYGLVDDSEVYWNSKVNQYGVASLWDVGMSASTSGVHDVVMRRNKIWNNWGEGLSTYMSQNITMEDNIVWDNWATNVYLQNTQYTVFQRNLVYRTANNPISGYGGSEIGIEIGDEQPTNMNSNLTIINNFVMGANKNLYAWQGNYGGGLVNCVIANNTFVNAASGSFANVQIGYGGSHVNTLIQNNIVEQDDSVPIAYINPTSGLTISDNNWSKTPPSGLGGPGDVIGNPQLAKTGSTAAGSLDPAYFTLLSSAPGIGKALPLSQVTVDFFSTPRGTSPDIGGDQHSSNTTDSTPPSVPSGLTASAVSSSQVNVTWAASTDNVGVTGYDVYRNGAKIGTTPQPSFQDSGLAAATAYSYAVAAYDGAGNVSGLSGSVSVTTPAATDTTAPSTPGGLTATAVSSSQVNLTWTASTDNVAVKGYYVSRNGSRVATVSTTSFQDTNLAASTTYSYSVAAFDSAGNVSPASPTVSATTQGGATSTSAQPLAITITYPLANSQISRNTVVTLQAQATDGLAITNITWNVDGVQIPGSNAVSATSTGTTAVGTATWSVGNGRGWHTIVATASDSSGATVSATVRVRTTQ